MPHAKEKVAGIHKAPVLVGPLTPQTTVKLSQSPGSRSQHSRHTADISCVFCQHRARAPMMPLCLQTHPLLLLLLCNWVLLGSGAGPVSQGNSQAVAHAAQPLGPLSSSHPGTDRSQHTALGCSSALLAEGPATSGRVGWHHLPWRCLNPAGHTSGRGGSEGQGPSCGTRCWVLRSQGQPEGTTSRLAFLFRHSNSYARAVPRPDSEIPLAFITKKDVNCSSCNFCSTVGHSVQVL